MAKLSDKEEENERHSSTRHDERSKKKRSRNDVEGDRKKRHHKSERHDRKNKDDESLLERRKKHSKKNENRHYSHSKHSSRHEHRNNRRRDDDEKVTRVVKQKVPSKKKRKQHRHEEVNPTNYLVPLGPVVNVAPTTLLDPDVDYFAYHSHLRLFLFRDDGTYFEDLTSEVARQEFQRFVNEYNAGRLEQAYYKEVLPLEALNQCKRTKHTWKFHTTTKEMESLHLVKEGVRKQTEYKADSSSAAAIMVNDDAPLINVEVRSTGDVCKPLNDLTTERRANRRLREHVLVAEEELAGGKKDYGRERQLEIQQKRAAAQHEAARDRQEAMVELDDRDMYGGDSFPAALVAREKQRQAKLTEEKASRILNLQEKERQTQSDMLKSIGLVGIIQPGQKITIAPRTD